MDLILANCFRLSVQSILFGHGVSVSEVRMFVNVGEWQLRSSINKELIAGCLGHAK